MRCISESGLYSLILTSRKEAAKRFKKWVMAEVLPAIRKTGSYSIAPPAPAAPMTREQIMAQALLLADQTMKEQAAQIEKQTAQIEVLAPKADALERIAESEGTFSITDAAKMLQVKPSFLFKWLGSHNWTFRWNGSGAWRGYQEKVDVGYLVGYILGVQSLAERLSDAAGIT
jgi:hypothetical protein